MSRASFEELQRRLQEISDLGKTMSLLAWDQQVMMPRRGNHRVLLEAKRDSPRAGCREQIADRVVTLRVGDCMRAALGDRKRELVARGDGG